MALPKLIKIIVYYPKFQVIFDNFGVIVYNFCFSIIFVANFEIECKGSTKTRFFHTLQALSEVNFVTD